MAKKLYVGVDNVAQRIKKAYIGINGTAKKIKKIYIGDANNIARLFYYDDNALMFASDSAFTLSVATPGLNGTIQYSLDNGANLTNLNGSSLSGDESHYILLRGIGNTVVTNGNTFEFTGKYVIGNIKNLLDYTIDNPTMGADCFRYLFRNCTSLEVPPDFPNIALSSMCFYSAFSGCTSLLYPPELPSTTLANYCYTYMFYNCSSLLYPPKLPSTTLADYCYTYMFCGCTSFTNMIKLPATTLNTYCYGGMFQGCTGIKISTTATADYSYAFRIPEEGTGTDMGNGVFDMFKNTGGTFTGTPTINTTYYTDNQLM